MLKCNIMNKIIQGISFAILLIYLIGCSDMDATYDEFIKDGPIIYIGKVDTLNWKLKTRAGKYRVRFDWGKQPDARARYVNIFWTNRSDTLMVPLNPDMATSVDVDGLKEQPYEFELVTYDDAGHKSVAEKILCNVYGDMYGALLYNRPMKSYELTDGNLTIVFPGSTDATLLGNEVVWEQDGEEHSAFIRRYPGEVPFTITDFNALILNNRSIYLPEPAAIDTFYTPFETINMVSAQPVKSYTCVNGDLKLTFPGSMDERFQKNEVRWTQGGQEYTDEIGRSSTDNTLEISAFNAPMLEYRSVYMLNGETFNSEWNVLDIVITCDKSKFLRWNEDTGIPYGSWSDLYEIEELWDNIVNDPSDNGNFFRNREYATPGDAASGNRPNISAALPSYATFDMGGEYTLDRLRINQRASGSTVDKGSPKTFTVYGAAEYDENTGFDPASWVKLGDFSLSKNDKQGAVIVGEEAKFDPTLASPVRYIKIEVHTLWGSDRQFNMAELTMMYVGNGE